VDFPVILNTPAVRGNVYQIGLPGLQILLINKQLFSKKNKKLILVILLCYTTKKIKKIKKYI
jgi:hypothetical protein